MHTLPLCPSAGHSTGWMFLPGANYLLQCAEEEVTPIPILLSLSVPLSLAWLNTCSRPTFTVPCRRMGTPWGSSSSQSLGLCACFCSSDDRVWQLRASRKNACVCSTQHQEWTGKPARQCSPEELLWNSNKSSPRILTPCYHAHPAFIRRKRRGGKKLYEVELCQKTSNITASSAVNLLLRERFPRLCLCPHF